MESGPIHLDHLVVAARTLEEGARWVEQRLGAAPAGGGKHTTMGTHNRVLSLGPEAYLEVIAIDPEAPAPPRPRWFSLDTPQMKARLAQGPALIHWVARTDDIERELARRGDADTEVLDLQRGDLRWRMAVPRDGLLREDGTLPTLIQWISASPSALLPDAGIRMQQLLLRKPGDPGPALRASFQLSRGGPAWLPE
jgi:hypothetical protein